MSSLPLAFCPDFFPNSDSSPLSRDSNSVSPHTPRISRAQLSNNDCTRSHFPAGTHSFLHSPLHPEAGRPGQAWPNQAPGWGGKAGISPEVTQSTCAPTAQSSVLMSGLSFSLQNSYQVYKSFQFKISPVKPQKQKWNQLPTNKFISFETLNYCLNISITS